MLSSLYTVMGDTTIAITIAIIAFILLFVQSGDGRVYVKASDGFRYKVRDTTRKQETAESLARINSNINKLLDQLTNSPDVELEYVPMIGRIKARYHPSILSEGKIDKNTTSYTINKGEQLVLCMRSRDSADELYNDNVLFYVALHEISHIGTISDHHSPEFHKNFRYIFRKAAEWNYFTPVSTAFNYCGLDVGRM